MVSNQEKVMIIRKKSVANPVKSRFAKKISKNQHSPLDSANNQDYNIVRTKEEELRKGNSLTNQPEFTKKQGNSSDEYVIRNERNVQPNRQFIKKER